jgi:hypothetical protein
MNPPEIPSAVSPKKKGLSGWAIAGIGCGVIVLAGIIGVGVVAKKAVDFVKENAGDFEKNPERAGLLMALKLNPAVEVVSVDDAKNSVTIKDKSNGKVVTLSFDDIKQGKMTISTEDGEVIKVDGTTTGEGGSVKITNSDGKVVTMNAQGGENGSVTINGPDGSTSFGAAKELPAWIPAYPGAKTEQGGVQSDTPEALSGVAVIQISDTPEKAKAHYEEKLKAAGYEVKTESVNAPGVNMAILTATLEAEGREVTITITTAEGKTQAMLNYKDQK